VSSSFHDRHEAGEALAERLELYKDDPNAIVLGLPRGGVVVAAAISEALKLPLNVLIARNLRAPCPKECTLGAVTETGVIYIDPSVLCVQNCMRSDLRAYLEHEIDVQKAEILRQKHLYRDDMSMADVNGKTVILADDGVATGATFFAAADALRKLGAEKIVGAVPVGPDEVIRNLRYKVDELNILLRPEGFVAISDYYGNFQQTSDEEVIRLLLASGIPGIPTRRRHVA
jgi:putative phosphoribosyl transferase